MKRDLAKEKRIVQALLNSAPSYQGGSYADVRLGEELTTYLLNQFTCPLHGGSLLDCSCGPRDADWR